jgi:predicted phage baseplate assembly protein
MACRYGGWNAGVPVNSRKDAMTDPPLDNRRFQDLLEQAQRVIAQRTGPAPRPVSQQAQKALLEATAMVVDQLVHRVNQLPGRLHRSLLDLVGIQRHPPTAAEVPITFWLTESLQDAVVIPRGAEVSDESASVVFTIAEPLELVPTSLVACAVQPAVGPTPLDLTDSLLPGIGVLAFGEQVGPGSALLLGLSAPAPACILSLTFDNELAGAGIDPRDPPLAWEVWGGDGWLACKVERDDTDGMCRSGEILLHLPSRHKTATFANREAAWVRCRVTEPHPYQPMYATSPTIKSVSAATVGGTVRAVHGHLIEDEPLGVSDGSPGQRFTLRHRPVALNLEPPVVEVFDEEWWPWQVVRTFADSGPFDRHVMVDAASGEVTFGPMVHGPDGTAEMYGECPSADALVRARRYWTGGGAEGNIAVGALSVLRTPVAGLPAHRIENPEHGTGGFDGESDEQLRLRAPLDLRARDRAVAAQDYERLVLDAAPEIARVYCAADQAGVIQVLLVPAVTRDESGRIDFRQLQTTRDTVNRVLSVLQERRVIGTRMRIEPASYQGFAAVCEVVASPLADQGEVHRWALAALYRYFDPLVGGRDGIGWPFGRPVGLGDVYSVLEQVPGVEYVNDVHLFPVDSNTGERFDAERRIEVDRYALLFPVDHQVRVTQR